MRCCLINMPTRTQSPSTHIETGRHGSNVEPQHQEQRQGELHGRVASKTKWNYGINGVCIQQETSPAIEEGIS